MRIMSKRRYQAIEPDEILIDAANLPAFDTARLEGKIEKPIGERAYQYFFAFVALLGTIALLQLANLQIVQHGSFVARAEANRLYHIEVIADRGLILDRWGEVLAENVPGDEPGLATRRYPLGEAAAHLTGYVTYPKRDQNGFWYQSSTEGIAGVEEVFDDTLKGSNGIRISETDASGETVSGAVAREPVPGANIRLSVDAGLQTELFTAISTRARESGWRGGSGAIMDIETGEILALASYPSFDPAVMSLGEPADEVNTILTDPISPLLDRAVSGLYAPGSVMKPFVAVAALERGVITPEKKILSTGSISIPNPYDPALSSVFRDWKAHGWVDMRSALAQSSDVYFYEVGGGFEDQPGLGISAIESFMRRFGFGRITGISFSGEAEGTIPNPAWKAENFDGEPWYLGNTYHTAIGQYGFQTTALQLVQGIAAIGNGGTLVSPVLVDGGHGSRTGTGVSDENLTVVREGMRKAVTEGTAQSISVYGLPVAGKTGTAEVGVRNEFTNSLIVGFFPYEHPRYAFTIIMERAHAGTLQGAPAAMRPVLEWIVAERPEMVE